MIEAAYDDSAGVTAEFNRNVLHVSTGSSTRTSRPMAFEHIAFFDRRHEWIEMRLRARRPCTVLVADARATGRIRRRRGAADRDQRQVHARARRRTTSRAAGLRLEQWFTDRDSRFALSLAGRP